MRINNPALRRLWEYAVITFGSALYAICFNCFFQPNYISMGGFTGVAQIVNRLIPLMPVGVTVIVLKRAPVSHRGAEAGTGASHLLPVRHGRGLP